MCSAKGTWRPRKMDALREAQVFRWINSKNPMQYGFDFGLWTRQIVQDLVLQHFDVSLSVVSAGAMLARLGLTAQKPLQRAYQRDPQAVERWQYETFPAIAQVAREQGADIFFWDETEFRTDTGHGKTLGLRGQTLVVNRPGQRQSISATSAVKKAVVKQYVASTNGTLTLHFLPGYAPDLNPDELVWSHAKRTGVARRLVRQGEDREQKVREQLPALADSPALV